MSQSAIIKQYDAIYRCAFKNYKVTVSDDRDNYVYDFERESKSKSLEYLFAQRKKICEELVKHKQHETSDAIALFEHINKEISKHFDITP
jgi:hypothetical protein